jgi:hypothetical protein
MRRDVLIGLVILTLKGSKLSIRNQFYEFYPEGVKLIKLFD